MMLDLTVVNADGSNVVTPFQEATSRLFDVLRKASGLTNAELARNLITLERAQSRLLDGKVVAITWKDPKRLRLHCARGDLRKVRLGPPADDGTQLKLQL